MKSLPGLLAFSLLCCLGTSSRLAAAPRQLTSPDQVPEGLGKSDWSSILAAHEGWKHQIHAVEGGWQAVNPGQQWTTRFDGRGFLSTPKDADWTWGLEFQSYGFGDRQTRVSGTPEVRTEGQRLSYQWTDTVEEWFVNDGRGLAHGFTLAERPAGRRENEALALTLATRGPLKPSLSADRHTVHFRDAATAPVLNYSGLKVWDADGTVLPSRFQVVGREVRLLVEENEARYPLTIDPIAQQAYLKPADPLGYAAVNDQFGYSVAVSGDTVVVGAPYEDSSSTGINSTPNESAERAGAAYLFVRSGTTWSQQAYLKPAAVGTSQEGDRFGSSVAVSGDTVVVGAPYDRSSSTGINSTPNESAYAAGAAYMFVRSAMTWSQQAYLKPAAVGASQADDYFGYSVAVSGNTVVVGALFEDSSSIGINSTPNESASRAGAAYVFARNGTMWSEQAYLKPAAVGTSQADDWFGYSVAVSGDTVVVGAPYENSSSTGINSTPNESGFDAGAAYVFVRSGTTWSQQAYLKRAAGSVQLFGYSVAVSGDTVVIGAPHESSSTTGINSTPNGSAVNAGAAYVFVRSGTTWSQQAYLKASQVSVADFFGYSVAASGDTVVVGARLEDSGRTGIDSTPNESDSDAGAAYVFVRSGTTWSQQAYLKPAAVGTSQAGDNFGYSVAVSGDTVIVGAPFEESSSIGINSTPNESASDAGAGYVFVRSGTTWSQQAYVKLADRLGYAGGGDNFGVAVAVSGDTVIVGASGEDSGSMGINSTPNETASDAGAVYVFVRSGTTWSQQAYLKASQVAAGDNFGSSVAVSGDTVIVGAVGVDEIEIDNVDYDAGAAYVFVRSGTSWSQQAYLVNDAGAYQDDRFGYSVAVSGDTAIVGMIGGSETSAYAGAAWVYVRSGTTWIQQAYLTSNQLSSDDYFGSSVAVSGDTVIVGASGENNSSGYDAGAAYVFVRGGTTWSLQAYLKPAAVGTSQSDRFGSSVGVSGDTVVVGAPSEDSSSTGINSMPNESDSDAGAAYVYARSGTTWSQQAYLKPAAVGTSQVGDRFGSAVAVSGDTVIVGAPYESTTTTGINSTPNESAYGAGAAYVYARSGTTWIQQAYLKASQVSVDDKFGHSVAVSGETVIVGAFGEDSSTTLINSTPDENGSDAGAAYIFTGLGPPPLLELVSPSTGSTSGGTTLTITGVNFTGASSVMIGGIPTSFTVNSPTSITTTTAAHPPGIVDVEVSTPIGTAIGSGLFTFLGREIAVEGPNGSDLTSETSTVDFGGVLTNAPANRTFVIRNTGNIPLSELAVSIVGTHDVEFVAVQPPGTVNGGGNVTFTVTFTPTANGLRSATLLIASDDENEDPFEVALNGTGSTAPQLLNGYATSAGLSGPDAEPGATPYKDGVPNLLKYAFNMNAGGSDRRTLVSGTGTAGLPVLRFVAVPTPVIRYEFIRLKHAGLTYTPRQSSSLAAGSWEDATGTTVVTPIDAEWERVVIEQAYQPGVNPRRFMTTVLTME